jgi:iron(III) transport system ATP-binding protein
MGMAALFVSHEPLDVWRLADRVLVLERGRLSQAATPQELYARPATPRAARFAGAHGGERLAVESESGRTGIRLGAVLQPATVIGLAAGEAGIAYVRPQGVRMAAGGIPARLQDCAFEAGQWRARWRLADCPLSVFTLEQAPPPAEARLELDEAHVFIYRAEADTADD